RMGADVRGSPGCVGPQWCQTRRATVLRKLERAGIPAGEGRVLEEGGEASVRRRRGGRSTTAVRTRAAGKWERDDCVQYPGQRSTMTHVCPPFVQAEAGGGNGH